MKKAQVFALLCALTSTSTLAKVCKPIPHNQGEIISVQSAKYLGGRVQLPANLIAKPTVSNPHLWDVDGIVGSNQILIKPNSTTPEGKSTMIFAFTDDGQVYDILASRVKAEKNQPCLMVNGRNQFSADQHKAISTFALKAREPSIPASVALSSAELERVKLELKTVKTHMKADKDKSIIEALRKYRYRIYTRYEWDEGDGFVGQYVISDVYDDGQFTYIRLSNPNRGILSVETQIGGKAAIAPMKYDDAYGMYKITGIYPKLRLRLDDVNVNVTRSDFATKGQ